MIINRNYKDRLFRMVFQEKENLLELYNAMNDSSYKNPEDLEITTIQDVIYMSMKNDVSFLIGDVLNLYEHQSTLNPNMPLRGLFYLADLYRKYIQERELNIYGKSRVRLPVPVYVVFYNGLEDEPDRMEMFLSDCFVNDPHMNPCLECKAVILNINLGHNRKLMEGCKRLNDYAKLVHQVRYFKEQGLEPETAVEEAVAFCISQGIMAEWLSGHRAEVMDVLLTEYDQEEHMRMERKEAKAEGFAEGAAKGRAEGITKGRAEGITEGILGFLVDLGEIPSELYELIDAQTNLNTLRGWIKLAARVKTVDEFLEQVKEK